MQRLVQPLVLGLSFLAWLAALPAAEAATLTVQVYRAGSWSMGEGDWIKGADVGVREMRKGRSYTRKSGVSGKAVFPRIGEGPVTLVVKKPGCGEVRKTFQMVRSNVTKNIELACRASGGAHKLTITTIDAGARSCGLSRVLPGQEVRLYVGTNANPVKTGTTNQQGKVTFTVPPGQYRGQAWNAAGCSMKRKVDISMPARTHAATLSVSCKPERYMLEARVAVSGAVPRAGGNLALSIVAKNLGPGQPSYAGEMWVSKRLKAGPANVWNHVGNYVQTFPVGPLCGGQTSVASVVDRNVKPGVWIYKAGFREDRRHREVGYRFPAIEVNILPATPKFRRMP